METEESEFVGMRPSKMLDFCINWCEEFVPEIGARKDFGNGIGLTIQNIEGEYWEIFSESLSGYRTIVAKVGYGQMFYYTNIAFAMIRAMQRGEI